MARHTPKYVIQDNSEVYNIAHHTLNVLLPDIPERVRQIHDTSHCPLTFLDKCHKPIEQSHYQGFNVSSIFYV